MSHRTQLVLKCLLLLLGVELWLVAGNGLWGMFFQVRWAAIAIVVASIPPVFRGISRALDAIRSPSPRRRMMTAIVIAVVASIYFVLTGLYQHREFAPRYHDEYVYLLQSRLLTTGRLWTSPHPLAEFFDTLYVFVRPVYAPKYFPGVALMLAPGLKLGLPYWAVMAAISGAAVGLVYRVTCELVDGVAGLVAAIALICVDGFRLVSLMAIGQAPVVLLGLGILWAWLRWRRAHKARWMIVAGMLAGWAALTRPMDALCFAVPVALAVMMDLRHKHREAGGGGFGRSLVRAGLAAVAGIAPFVLLQGAMNVGVTGSVWSTPFGHYNALYQPAVKLGFADPDLLPRPQTTLPDKLALYDQLVLPFARSHREQRFMAVWVKERLPQLLVNGVPHPMLLMLLPIGVAALVSRRRGWVILAIVPLFVGLYYFYPIFLPHYLAATAPAVVICLGAAVAWLPEGAGRAKRWTGSVVTTVVLVLTISTMPELDRSQHDEGPFRSELRAVDRLLAALPGPSVVLFRFAPNFNIHSEPVYNLATANPDDSRIIRARDLGADNLRLYRYYAARNPQRALYRYDEGDDTLTYLGTAAELAGASSRPATKP